MTDTPNLALPYILASQAQKHVTHNEAIRALDCLVQLSVESRVLTSPPASPADGSRYVVAAGASGDWTGQSGKIAAFQDGIWVFYTPRDGWIAWVASENIFIAYDTAAWSPLPTGGITDHAMLTGLADDDHLQYLTNARGDARYTPINPSTLGINAAPDTTNRLALSSPASLFNHEGNGHQVKVNKHAASDTASFLFQDNFSGRAEIGLTGDDDFHFKVSADGSTWFEGIKIARATGKVSFPNSGGPRELLSANRTYYVGFNLGTGTVTIATPGVWTLNAHGLANNQRVVFSIQPRRATLSSVTVGANALVTTSAPHGYAADQPIKLRAGGNGVNTTGTFPTGITAGTTYYVIATGLTATAFEFSTSVGGAAVTTSGSAMAGTNYVEATGALPTGVTEGTAYFARNVTTNTFEVSTTSGGASIATSGTQSGIFNVMTGSDSNSGLANSASGALLTLQAAYNIVTSSLDLGGKNVTISAAAALFTAGVLISQPWTGGGGVILEGNSAARISASGNVINWTCRAGRFRSRRLGMP